MKISDLSKLLNNSNDFDHFVELWNAYIIQTEIELAAEKTKKQEEKKKFFNSLKIY